MNTLEFIVPCYNESEALPAFYEAVSKVFANLSGVAASLIFVDDGSRDSTLEAIKSIAEKDSSVKYISFSRNFGKEAAMLAGLKMSRADFVGIIDADLQHSPELIPEMLKAVADEGYDIAAARRVDRSGEAKLKSAFSRAFYKLINRISDAQIEEGAQDFRIMSRKVVNAIISMPEYNRFSKGIFSWVGFNTKWISFKTVDRQLGKTSWKFSSLFKYAIDGITCFSVAPLRFTAIMGAVIFFISLIYIIITLIQTLFFGITTPGYVTTLCAVLFLGGITEMSIGILGEYIGKIYMETKDRPIYITKFSNFEDENNEEHDGQA